MKVLRSVVPVRAAVSELMAYSRIFVALFIAGLLPAPGLAQRSCESLSGVRLPDTSITLAEPEAGGPSRLSPSSPILPPYCRVAGAIKPTPDSNIKFEVWMPSPPAWNGKFDGVDNGGFGGFINRQALVTALHAGFAAASTDTGHAAGWMDAQWALGHPEKVADFGYRAIHLMTVAAKSIVRNYYGTPARWSYFAGCSNGGRQGLMEAQRFPADYDGIIAGAPVNFMTHLVAAAIWDSQATLADPASYIPASKLPAIHNAVLAACDSEDGVKDGILSDPTECHFNPKTLLCKGADSNACLTAPQVAALGKIYAGPSNAKGQRVYPGLMPGGELGRNSWVTWITGSAPQLNGQFFLGMEFFSNMVFENPAWDYRKFNFNTDVQLTDRKLAQILNATDPHLERFRARGGKLILYHGWSDSAAPPLNTVDYYESVVAAMGRKETDGFVRLYMLPGMHHCGDGPAPCSFGASPSADLDPEHSVFSSIEQWVEHGVEPHRIVASKYVSPDNPASGALMARPLCAYPEFAKYQGSGDIHEAANFSCTRNR